MGRIVVVKVQDLAIHQTFSVSGVQKHWRHYHGMDQWAYMASAYVPELQYKGKETILKEYHRSQFTVYTDLYNESNLPRLLARGIKVPSPKYW